ncbi:MAG: LolA-related protein [Wenzhouxiangella sp.]
MLATGTTPAADPLDEHLSRVAGQAEREVAFLEVRRSEMLEDEVEIRGMFRREPGDRLVRETTEPFHEIHRLTPTHVEITKPSGARQRFRLERAPELAVLRHALAAVLDGDAGALREHFDVDFSGNDEQWRLRLTPTAESLAGSVESLELAGRDARIEEMVLRLVEGEVFHTEIDPAR